jgi:hypothetical protein
MEKLCSRECRRIELRDWEVIAQLRGGDISRLAILYITIELRRRNIKSSRRERPTNARIRRSLRLRCSCSLWLSGLCAGILSYGSGAAGHTFVVSRPIIVVKAAASVQEVGLTQSLRLDLLVARITWRQI